MDIHQLPFPLFPDENLGLNPADCVGFAGFPADAVGGVGEDGDGGIFVDKLDFRFPGDEVDAGIGFLDQPGDKLPEDILRPGKLPPDGDEGGGVLLRPDGEEVLRGAGVDCFFCTARSG